MQHHTRHGKAGVLSRIARVTTIGGVTWAGVDAGLWVAFGDGTHLGRVDATAGGRFRSYSSCGTELGVFATLPLAERAVEAAAAAA